jgi:hypothetical protein
MVFPEERAALQDDLLHCIANIGRALKRKQVGNAWQQRNQTFLDRLGHASKAGFEISSDLS